MQHTFTYANILSAAQRAQWRIGDILSESAALDFGRPFLPESLAQTAGFGFLTQAEQLLLNQIRGHNYLYLFGLVEEFILPFLEAHIGSLDSEDQSRLAALVNFAAEEEKHIELFKRFRTVFVRDFGHECAVIGPAEAVAKEVLRHPPLAVALMILHIEWMTQRHYLESVRGEDGLDPCFSDLLRYHWIEEAQHARLDALIVWELAAAASGPEIEAAIDGYLAILAFLDAGLSQQVDFDIASLAAASGRQLSAAERETIRRAQLAAMRWTFIGSGMTHETFRSIVHRISAPGAMRIARAAEGYC